MFLIKPRHRRSRPPICSASEESAQPAPAYPAYVVGLGGAGFGFGRAGLLGFSPWVYPARCSQCGRHGERK